MLFGEYLGDLDPRRQGLLRVLTYIIEHELAGCWVK